MRKYSTVYLTSMLWFIMSLVSSVTNDIISKYAGVELHTLQVSFLRFLFSALMLIPVIMYQGSSCLKSSSASIHILRGILLFFGMSAWTYGLSFVPITTATVISFSIPLFTLILAVFFLRENIIWQRWVVTIIGFIGVFITLSPELSKFSMHGIIFILASLAFASLDIINKIFIVKETMVSMLFYSAIVTALLGLPGALYYWQTPTVFQILLFMVLGASANLILFFILKAFKGIDATALAPLRYLELILSSIAGYIIFNEAPTKPTLYGAAVIIPATLFIVYSEQKKSSHNKQLNKNKKVN